MKLNEKSTPEDLLAWAKYWADQSYGIGRDGWCEAVRLIEGLLARPLPSEDASETVCPKGHRLVGRMCYRCYLGEP